MEFKIVKTTKEIKERIEDLAMEYIPNKKPGNPFLFILEGEFQGLCWVLGLDPSEVKKELKKK